MSFTVVLDANVLYPAPLRDFLLHLAVTDLFSAKWTEKIHHEWISNLLKNWPDLTSEKLYRSKQLMNKNVRDCLVTDFEDIEASLELPDPNDHHVLAAAIKSNAQAIVTFNRKDFPADRLAKWNIEAISPDEFIQYQLGLNMGLVCQVARRHRKSLKNPPKLVSEYLDTLESCGLAVSADILRGFADNL